MKFLEKLLPGRKLREELEYAELQFLQADEKLFEMEEELLKRDKDNAKLMKEVMELRKRIGLGDGARRVQSVPPTSPELQKLLDDEKLTQARAKLKAAINDYFIQVCATGEKKPPQCTTVVYGHSLPEDVETIKNLREALAFYACDSNWVDSAFGPDSSLTRVIWDGGSIAEAALSDEAGLFPKDERQVP